MEFCNVNPFDGILAEGVEIQSGTMVYELVCEKDSAPEFALMIKEDTEYIQKHKYNPIMQVRIGLMRFDNVWIVPIMLLINNDFNMLYESVFNYHQTEGGAKYLQALSKQDRIVAMMYDEQFQNIRNIEMKNNMKDDMIEIGWRLSNTQAWSMSEFDEAKQKMYLKFPSPKILWNNLTAIGKTL